MKKPSAKARRYSIIVTRKRTWRRRRHERPPRVRRQKRRRANRWGTYDWIDAPENFAIESREQRRKMVTFLTSLRSRVMTSKKSVRINFDRTVFMSAAATLLFAAELDRLSALRPGWLTGTWPLSNRIAQVIHHLGIAAKLGIKGTCKITRDDVTTWRMDTGSEADGRRAHHVMEQYEHLFSAPMRKLYAGLTEAMVNCRQHAYDDVRGDGYGNVLPNWWAFSQYKDGRVCVVLCDLGIGIPRSLPMDKSGLWGLIRRVVRLARWEDNDVRRVQAAMRIGASRTLRRHRGKGLMEMRSVLDELGGRMHIHSNRGYYLYDSATKIETCTNFPLASSILGTVILWQIPVETQASS